MGKEAEMPTRTQNCKSQFNEDAGEDKITTEKIDCFVSPLGPMRLLRFHRNWQLQSQP
tara:strand:- start:29284 stop:29457 length:174 start_codon:yes stop_codon:yes gene_type:complete